MNGIFESAKAYFDSGFNIVTVKLSIASDGSIEKKPLTEWSEWRRRRQTAEEFKGQNWAEADGFAVILDFPNRDGLYLAVVDRDRKNVNEESFKNGWRFYRQFPTTRIEGTINDGEHKIYLSRIPAKSISDFHDKYGLELLGLGKICVMAPSRGYTIRIADEPAVVEDIQGIFETILGIRKRENVNERETSKSLLLDKVIAKLNVVRDMNTYVLAHCPFHPPDKNPSLAIYRNTGLAVDFHTGERFSIKELAEKLGVEDEEEELKRYFKDEIFVPKKLSDELMRDFKFITIKDTDEIYVFHEGCYKPHGEILIKQECEKRLGEEYRKRRAEEVIEYIKAATYTERREEPPHLIPLKNGVLDLNTFELKPYSADMMFFNEIPVEYNKSADCPEIKNFLREIVATEEDVRVLLEVIGFCLYREYFIAKALMLVGGGSNGKSTFLNLVKTFLGKENVVGRSLQDLEENRFAKADLHHKLANIYADLPSRALKQTGTFKMLTGRDLITAEKKFQRSFNFENYAKLLFSANKVPEAEDDTDAFFRRWLIIVFPKQFTDEDADPHILQKITTPTELSGLLNLVLPALKGLLERGEFSISKTTEEIRKDYVRKSSPIEAFVMDCLEINSDAYVKKKVLYQAFCRYCNERKLPAVTQDTFFKSLPRYVAVTDYRVKTENGRESAFKGICFKEQTAENAEDVNRVKGVNPLSNFFPNSPLSSSLEKCDGKEKLGTNDGSVKKIWKTLDRVDRVDTAAYSAPPLSRDSKVIDIYRCGDCAFYEGAKCLLRREWVTVMPAHPACEFFKPREAAES